MPETKLSGEGTMGKAWGGRPKWLARDLYRKCPRDSSQTMPLVGAGCELQHDGPGRERHGSASLPELSLSWGLVKCLQESTS